jgi:hypothetical protein
MYTLHLSSLFYVTNRVSLVKHSKDDLFRALSTCLSSDAAASDRRLALLLINNLCIPIENKQFIMNGEAEEVLLPTMLRIIKEHSPDSHLAAVCLFNLSFLEETKTMLIAYLPAQNDNVKSDYSYTRPIDNPDSLIRVMESIVKEYAPTVLANPLVHSVQAECTRWSIGSMRNFSTIHENALVIAQSTDLVSIALQLIAEFSKHDMALWTRDSLPDACIMLLVHIIKYPDCLACLDKAAVIDALSTLKTRGGIHAMRANAVILQLEGKESYETLVLGDAK